MELDEHAKKTMDKREELYTDIRKLVSMVRDHGSFMGTTEEVHDYFKTLDKIEAHLEIYDARD